MIYLQKETFEFSVADLIAMLQYIEEGRFYIPEFTPGVKEILIEEINYRILLLVKKDNLEKSDQLASETQNKGFAPCSGCGEVFQTFANVITRNAGYCSKCCNSRKT